MKPSHRLCERTAINMNEKVFCSAPTLDGDDLCDREATTDRDGDPLCAECAERLDRDRNATASEVMAESIERASRLATSLVDDRPWNFVASRR